MRRLLAFLLATFAAAAWAGDVARFVNLGFSRDDRYFLFGQYGVDEKSLAPYAELSLVDVESNRFVPGGVRKASYTSMVEPGATGEGALYNLLREASEVIGRHGIDHVRTGRPLYVLVGTDPEPADMLSFRDFQTGSRYEMRLVQKTYGEGEKIESAFHIELTIRPASGAAATYRMGSPDYRRRGVKGYRVAQVILSPTGGALVAVVERRERDSGGANVRYMVETLRLR